MALLGLVLLEMAAAGESPWLARPRVVAGGAALAGVVVPPAALVRITRSGVMRCSGGLIGRQQVITAAHCLVGLDVATLAVRIGTSYAVAGGEGVVRAVVETLVHPGYDGRVRSGYDVAIMVLDEAVDSNKVSPLPLAAVRPPNGLDGVLVGFGATHPSGSTASLPATARYGDVRVAPPSECGYKGGVINASQHICASAPSRSEMTSCAGDSGGPMLVPVRGEPTAWLVAGVASFGSVVCGSEGRKGVYVRIDAVVAWIRSVVPEALVAHPGARGQTTELALSGEALGPALEAVAPANATRIVVLAGSAFVPLAGVALASVAPNNSVLVVGESGRLVVDGPLATGGVLALRFNSSLDIGSVGSVLAGGLAVSAQSRLLVRMARPSRDPAQAPLRAGPRGLALAGTLRIEFDDPSATAANVSVDGVGTVVGAATGEAVGDIDAVELVGVDGKLASFGGAGIQVVCAASACTLQMRRSQGSAAELSPAAIAAIVGAALAGGLLAGLLGLWLWRTTRILGRTTPDASDLRRRKRRRGRRQIKRRMRPFSAGPLVVGVVGNVLDFGSVDLIVDADARVYAAVVGRLCE
ncbi:serine protease 27 [Thecamonas trahens ATCC 50062]|uniref:Serine protease 27 n=1 Tax=Thecamonas trahens ATCC 50062 TaxID=461836 RepID=A0A0L0DFK3_THETB|nr:serine protease 27 [Thecamonas trahens ATCC 50062]KNC50946.1 serine protease 27 [Thecamonas trahens ATCC 50062]|eukprot:XP_013756643.1 serine protease 27 [Thecamonas trahens ATCC 50062]